MKKLYSLQVFFSVILMFAFITANTQESKEGSRSSDPQIELKRTGDPSKPYDGSGRATVTVTPLSGGTTPTDLVESILGPGITYSNVSFTGTQGAQTSSAGLFTGGVQAGFDINEGAMLSSGYIQNVLGPNTSNSISANLGLSGDSDLENLIPSWQRTYDATVLEFDFEVPSDELNIQFVFGSDEYNEYVGSQYNDVFAFYVDGVNIAFVPTSNDPVTINTINNGSNSQHYFDNERPNDTEDIEADGFTTNLIGEVTLTPNVTHHMKIAIADAGDRIYDSWVFIQEGSFSIPIEVDLGPDQTICEGEEVTLDAGNPGFNYLWSPGGETTQTITVSPSVTTNYSVQVYLGGNSGSDQVTINVVQAATAYAGPDAETCQGIAYSIPSGDASASSQSSLLWTHNGTGSLSNDNTLTPTYTPGNGETGDVTLTLTAFGNGDCDDAEDFMILTINPSPVLTATPTQPNCFGELGSVQLSAVGGTEPYTYGGDATTDLTAGEYTYTVTDANGCTDETTITINAAPDQLILTATPTQPNCFGELGSVQLSAVGGTEPYTYGGDATTDLTAGEYTYTVTDANGCTDETTITINAAPDQLILTATPTQPNCFGELGSVQLSAVGGTEPYTYGGDATTDLTAGEYTYTVTDANGCTDETTITINAAPDQLILTATPTQPNCFGELGSVQLSAVGGTEPYTYGGDATTDLTAGEYTYTVTDANGCTDETTITINAAPDQLILTATPTQPNCFGELGSVQLSAVGGTEPYTYGGDATTDLTAGEYTYTVTDANGCTDETTITINAAPDQLILTATPTQPNCFGELGSVQLSAVGGTEPYTYGGDATTDLTAGEYTYTVTDANGCTDETTITINAAPDQLILTATPTQPNCFGELGSVQLSAVGGTEPYTYGGDATTDLTAGEYTYTVTDANGCTDETTITINAAPDQLILTATPTQPNCFGELGSVQLSAVGGTEPYTYGGDATTDLTAGEYTYTVTDANGCTDETTITINAAPDQLILTATPTQPNCFGELGSVQLSAVGGTEPYTYGGDATTDLTAGEYTYTVTDANGCTDETTITINAAPDQLILTATPTQPNCFGELGSVQLSAVGGTEPYTYGGDATTDLTAGEYTYTVTDANGCTDETTITINAAPDQLILTATPTQPNCFGELGSVQLSAVGGTEPYTYGGDATTDLTAGEYTYTVTDANGCTDETTITINAAPDQLILTATPTQPNCFGELGSVQLSAVGGTEPYTYGGDATTDLTAGEYTYTVTDANGCTDETTITINAAPDQLILTATPTQPNCFGELGSVQLSAVGGTEPYTYGGDATTDLTAGEYTYTVTDANGCTDETTITINAAPDQLILTATPTQPNCFGELGSVQLSAVGGTEPYTYGGDATTDLTAGEYTYTVTDANGCTDETTITINAAPDQLILTATPTQPNCFGELGSVQLSAVGGTEPYTYGGDATTDLTAGEYTYTVTDANGCTDETTITINAAPDQLILTATPTQPNCFGELGSVQLSAVGGTEPYTYGGDATTDLTAGEYTYTVTDANGCTDETTITINAAPDQLILTATPTQPNCFGELGSVQLSAVGGTEPYTYGGDATTDLTAGEYTYTVTDANGCTDETTITINAAPDQLILTATPTQPNCFGELGSVQLSAVGGTEPYTYGGDATTDLIAGDYTYTVTDANGCTDETTITINAAPDQLILTATPTQPNCFGELGSVQLSAVGGTEPYTYGGDATTDLIAGDYTYTVTDANGCTDETTITINAAPDQLILTATPTQPNCFGELGSVQLSAVGGTEPYTYGGDATTDLTAGEYTYTVTDANGCTDETTITIAEPAELIADISNEPIECYGGTITIELIANGGTPEYNYTFNGVTNSTGIFENIGAGVDYPWLVIDANGCEVSGTITLSEPPEIFAEAGEDGEICETDSYQLQGNAENYSSVEWSGGTGTFSDANSLNAVYTPGDGETGNVILTLTAYGIGSCEDASDNMTLTVTPAPTADAGPDAETCEEMAFTITGASASNYSSFQWTFNGSGSLSNTNTLSPTYTPGIGETGIVPIALTVYGEGSCDIEVASIMILTITPAPIADAGPDDETCEAMAFTITGASAVNYSSVLWTHNGNGTLDDSNTLTPTYTPGSDEIGQVILTLTVEGTGSCGENEDSMTLTITPAPSVDAGNDDEICETGTFTLQGSADNYDYIKWTGGAGTFSDVNSLNAIYTPGENETGDIVLTLTAYGNGSCEEVSDNMTLTITPAPSVDAGDDAEICETDLSYILQGAADNYNYIEWTGGTGTFSDVNSLNTTYTPGENETGNVVLTLTAYGNGSCEEVSDAMTLSITTLPVVDAGPAGQTCEETNYEITGASASNYTTIHWTTDGAGILYNASTINPIYAPAEGEIGVVTFTLTATGNGSCGEVSDETTLTILGAPAAYAGPDEQTCQNQAFTVTGASAENYNSVSWSHNGAGSLTDANTLNPTYIPAADELGEVVLTLNVQGNAYCGDATDEMTLTIISGAYAFAGEDATVCETELYELADAIANNYTSILWTTSGDGEFSNNTILNPVYSAGSGDLLSGNVTLTLTVNGVGSCGDVSDEMTITYNPVPEVFAGEDANTCANDAYTITDATAINYGSLLWTTNGDGTFNNNNLLNPIYTPGTADITAGSVVLFITAYSETSCPDVTDEMTLSITLQPDVYAGEDALTCGTDGYELIDATADMYESLLWTTSGDGVFDDATIQNPVYTPGTDDISEGSVVLTLTAFGSGSCGDASDEMTLEFVPEPTVYAGEDVETCASDASIEIGSSSASNYVSLMWTTSGDGSFDDNTILDPIYTAGANDIASGQVTLTLTAFAAGNCNDAIDEMLVMINANPVADAGTDQTIQIGTSTTLTGSATGGSGLYAYYWSPEELLVDPNEQNPTTVGLNTNPTIFILQVTDGMTGCYAYDTVLINLENIPEDVVVAVDDYDTTDFNTTTVIDILLNDAYPSEEIPNISICDAPANGMVVINSDGTITYTPNIDFVGEDVFCYKICDAELTNLCDSAMVYVQVQEGSTPPDDLIIFNALTPNGDGMNDTWIIQGIENYPDNKVYLFNRWGDEIHFLEGYDNTRIYWDGKNKKDRMLPDGTYYYVFYIKIEGVEKVFTGWVFMHGANQQ